MKKKSLKNKITKNKSQKEKKIICYTGLGKARKNGIHTKEEFMKLAKADWEKSKQNYLKWLKNKPKTLNEWMKWMGAGYTTSKKCKDEVKNIEEMLKKIRSKSKSKSK